MTRRIQHSKGRPRRWHRGKAQGEVNERAMVEHVNPVFDRAELDRVEAAAASELSRADLRDWQELWGSLSRVAPFVPRWELRL